MDTDRLDRELADLETATARISANLVELELDADRRYVDASTLTGDSERRLQAAEATIAELWQQHEQLDRLLEKGRRLRKRGWLVPQLLDELEQLLEGPSIPVASAQVPIAERKLLADPQNTVALTPTQLLARMSTSFDEAKAVFAQLAGAGRDTLPSLRAAQDRIADAIALAERLGVRSRPDLVAAERSLAPLADRVLHDPLSVQPAEVEAVARSVDAIGAELAGMVALSEEIVGRLDRARGQLAGLRTLAREGAAAHDALAARIVAPAPAPIEVGAELDRGLERISQLADCGDWPGAHAALARWTESLDALRDRAQTIVAANRAPIESRNELRGLLDAYQAKAGRLGLIEEPQLASLFERAREALYIAPTDLAAAGELVRDCQDGVRRRESELKGERR
jgi:hypothetical protein